MRMSDWRADVCSSDLLALSAADIRRLHAEGKRVALIGIENGYAIGTHPELLDIYYGLGARYFGLAHNGHNDIGDSAQPRADHGDRPRSDERRAGTECVGTSRTRWSACH